ncbi:hypothetical protein TrST_g12749 [Triparma strigata]|uniref:Uncharacterized protein n=1 Tax=Triparma strigata TaxID=1606541 RepID=A0A9W7C5H1_9STRA|nr:hypothetical protein TrST_g12749 [Triparma strigata]
MAHTIADLRSNLSNPLSSHSDHFLKCLLLMCSCANKRPKEVAKTITKKYNELRKQITLQGNTSNSSSTMEDHLPKEIMDSFFGDDTDSADTYEIKITSETLGLTVENVLERTVVRTVIPNQSAFLAGALVGSVVSKVGPRSTDNCTHFETIDELRQSVRPLTLTLKNVPPQSLNRGRTLMSSLIDNAEGVRTSTVASVSQRMCEILVIAVALFKEAKDEEKVLGVGKVLKEYIKRCGGHGEEKVTDSVNYGTADPSSVEVSLNGVDLNSSVDNQLPPTSPPLPPTPQPSTTTSFHFTSTPLLLNDCLQRSQSLLSHFSPTSPIQPLLLPLISLLTSVLEFDTQNSPSYDYNSTDDLGAAGNLIKVVVRQACLGEKVWGNRFVSVVHGLSGSKSPLSRKVGVSLCPILWSFATFPYRLQLRGIITRSLHDIDQTVRRSTGRVLTEIVEGREREVPWLVLMCERAMTDPVGELRGNAVSLVCSLCERCQEETEEEGEKRNKRDASSLLFEDIYLLQCKLLPIATRLAEDKSPNVRLAVASHADRLVGALGSHWIIVLNDLFTALLQDEDEKVRTEAVYTVPRLVHQVFKTADVDMQAEVLESVFRSMTRMVTDDSPSVRVSLATSAGQMLVLITRPNASLEDEDTRNSITSNDGNPAAPSSPTHQQQAPKPPSPKKGVMSMISSSRPKPPLPPPSPSNPHLHYVDENVLPVVQRLLHDGDPSVCSNALRAVANASHSINSTKTEHEGVDFVPVLKEKQVLRLLPTLTHLSTNPQWRVRRSAVEVVPALVKSTTSLKSRASIGSLAVSLLTDPVSEVRKSASFALCTASTMKKKKDDWLEYIVLPELNASVGVKDHRVRLVAVFMLRTLINKHVDEKVYLKDKGVNVCKFFYMTVKMKNDRLANVRLNVGKTLAECDWKGVLEEIKTEESERVKGEIKKCLKVMAKDADADVRYFSRVARGEV